MAWTFRRTDGLVSWSRGSTVLIVPETGSILNIPMGSPEEMAYRIILLSSAKKATC